MHFGMEFASVWGRGGFCVQPLAPIKTGCKMMVVLTMTDLSFDVNGLSAVGLTLALVAGVRVRESPPCGTGRTDTGRRRRLRQPAPRPAAPPDRYVESEHCSQGWIQEGRPGVRA